MSVMQYRKVPCRVEYLILRLVWKNKNIRILELLLNGNRCKIKSLRFFCAFFVNAENLSGLSRLHSKMLPKK